jgi:hypothetical protein
MFWRHIRLRRTPLYGNFTFSLPFISLRFIWVNIHRPDGGRWSGFCRVWPASISNPIFCAWIIYHPNDGSSKPRRNVGHVSASHNTAVFIFVTVSTSNLICTITYSGFSIHDGTLLHSKSQYTTVKHSRKLSEHTYTSDPHGLGTLTAIEFFQQDLLCQSSNTRSHSCSQKASKHTSGQSIVGLSVRLHTTTAPRRIVHH